MRFLLILPITFMLSMAASMTSWVSSASATILPLDVCSGNICVWSGLPVEVDPSTGDIWIKFESTPAAGDKGHIEGNPDDFWQVLFGGTGIGLNSLYGVPFLTDMDNPISELDVTITNTANPNTLDFTALFRNPVFVHDIHWECVDTADACLAATTNLVGPSIVSTNGSPSGAPVNFITGIWEIPEPGTLALFGAGLAGLGFARRRKAA